METHSSFSLPHLLLKDPSFEEVGSSPPLVLQCPSDMQQQQQQQQQQEPDLDLECRVPLPQGWEQFLDLRTGQVYYIDWKNFRRSYTDPRKLIQDGSKNDSWLLDNQSGITDQGTSDSINNYEGGGSKSGVTDAPVIMTYPMLQEDWDLMESRGWTYVATDDHSEIGSERSRSQQSYDKYSAANEAESRAKESASR